MILSIDSSIPTFKSLQFHPGLNVLLADARDKSASGKTRNSAGKSSFVLIVDFLLGANCDKQSLFRSPAIIDETFGGQFKFGDIEIRIQRTGSDPSKIFVIAGEHAFKDKLEIDTSTQRVFVQLSDWKRFLGHTCFGLPSNPVRSAFSETSAPSARSMLKYFMRLASDGGFSHPERTSSNQQRASWQTALSYIFGLDWRIAQEFQVVRDREKTLKTLKNAADGGVFGEIVGTVAKLRPQMVLAAQRAAAKRDQIANFQVLESYKDLSDEAANLQQVMQSASRRLVTLKETLAYLEEAYASEEPRYAVDIHAMYEASGIELPDVALRRIDEVEAFQASVVENRKIHLQTEIDQTKRQISAADEELVWAANARKRAMISLEGRGAFEDLVELQRELSRLEAEHANLVERFKAAEALESNRIELKVDRIELQRRLQADHNTHSESINAVILRVAELIDALYENREGRFEVSATENGPEFSIHIEGDRGTGIRSMEVFCMDIALFESVKRRFGGPGFLIHDSHLFDGVDARQIMTALLVGRDSAADTDQYIVTLNSDIFDSLPFPEEFDRDDAIIPARLSDEGETGGLFGFRFD